MKTTICLETFIDAPVERCFDLSRSIDFHIFSSNGSGERAAAGKTRGLIEQGESVTWEATHFLVRQLLTTKIQSMQRPSRFYVVMQKGAFKSMEHEHLFRDSNGGTIMIDKFVYEPPYGAIGKLFNKLILRRYMINILLERNQSIKATAESETWKDFLSGE